MFQDYIRQSKITLSLAIPFIVTQLLQASVALIDILMAGSDSSLTLAAISQGSSLFVIVQFSIFGLLMPLSPLFARLYAQENNKIIKETFQQGVWLAIALSFFGIFLVLLLINLMAIIGVDEEIISPAKDYLMIMSLSIPFFVISLPIRFLYEGIAKPKVMLYITILSMPVNIIGNYIFINGLFGLPKMGVSGIALSSLISLAIVSFISWVYLIKDRQMYFLRLLDSFNAPNYREIINIIKTGTPKAISILMEIGIFSAIALLSGKMGVEVTAANKIASSYTEIILMFSLGLSFAITTRIGMAYGENDIKKIRVIGLSGAMISVVFMLFSIILIVFYGDFIASLYSSDDNIINIATGILLVAALSQIPDGIQVCSYGALLGLEETKSPMYYSIFGYWILSMPMAVLLAFYFDIGAKGLWLGLGCGLFITSILSIRRFIDLTKNIPTL